MENNNENKLGGGIIAVSILLLIGAVISIFSSVSVVTNRSFYEKTYKQLGVSMPSNTIYYIFIALSVVIMLSVILVLLKKSLGIYGYFTAVIINFIANIIISGFTVLMLANLILPAIYLALIMSKKQVFGFGNDAN